jgi:hypothetical protein
MPTQRRFARAIYTDKGKPTRNVFDWSDVGFEGEGTCSEWKADIAFAFLSAILWLVSALLGYVYSQEMPSVLSVHGTNELSK